MKTELDFHLARTMWAVTDHGLHIADPGDVRNHKQWLSAWFGAELVEKFWDETVRGYVLGDRLSAYVGDDFHEPMGAEHKDVVLALKKFPQVRVVALGAIKTPDVQPWPSRSTHTRWRYLEAHS